MEDEWSAHHDDPTHYRSRKSIKTFENFFYDVASCLWQVSVIKAKISTEFGMPSGKQKLQIGVCACAMVCLYKSVLLPQTFS